MTDVATRTGPGSHTARTVIIVSIVAAAFALVWRYDTEVYHALRAPDPEKVVLRAWYQFLRSFGYLPLWIALGVAILAESVFLDRRRRGPSPWSGFLLGIVPALAAGIAEGTQHIFGRLKPSLTGGVHRYHGLPDVPGAHPSFGFPSSHAAVAFGGAFVVMMVFPRAGLVALLLAVGCAWTRVLQGGHFASDVFASGVIGYACARLLRPRPNS